MVELIQEQSERIQPNIIVLGGLLLHDSDMKKLSRFPYFSDIVNLNTKNESLNILPEYKSAGKKRIKFDVYQKDECYIISTYHPGYISYISECISLMKRFKEVIEKRY